MRVLGIDPGSLRVGWGIVEGVGSTLQLQALGVVRPRARDPLAQRLAVIHTELCGIRASYAPDLTAIESVFHGVNTRALVTLGQARGVAMAAAGHAGGEVLELSPAEIKKALTGRGQATKDQVAHMVGALLGPKAQRRIAESGLPADVTDALAIAIAALNRASIRVLGGVSTRALPGRAER
jgi:crossover junction endodeoxyribonuclease RuvC